MTKSKVFHPLFIFLLALAIRVVLFGFDDGHVPDTGNSPDYLMLAESVKEGNGFTFDGYNPTAEYVPIYPAFLAGVLLLPGAGIRTIQLFQILIDSITCLLIYFLSLKLTNKSHALLGGFFMALYIPLASRSLFILSETLFTFFLVATVLILACGRSRIQYSALSGLVMGIVTLVRPNGLVIAFFMLIWFYFNYGFKRSLRHALAFVFCFILILSPWIIRNAVIFHHFIPTSTIPKSFAFYNSYFIPEKGYGFNEIKTEHSDYFNIDNEIDKNAYLIAVTMKHIKRHPLQAIKLIPVKLSLLVYPFDLQWLRPAFPFRFNIFWSVISILAVIAIFSQPDLIRTRMNILIFLLGALLLTTIVFYGSPRMRAPYVPFIIILSAVSTLWIWRKERRWFWITGIFSCNLIILFLAESSCFIEMIKNLKPW